MNIISESIRKIRGEKEQNISRKFQVSILEIFIGSKNKKKFQKIETLKFRYFQAIIFEIVVLAS